MGYISLISTIQLVKWKQAETIYKQWALLCSNKTLLKQDAGQIWPGGHSLLTPTLSSILDDCLTTFSAQHTTTLHTCPVTWGVSSKVWISLGFEAYTREQMILYNLSETPNYTEHGLTNSRWLCHKYKVWYLGLWHSPSLPAILQNMDTTLSYNSSQRCLAVVPNVWGWAGSLQI